MLAVFLDRLGVPALAFGLGMYLPQELNTPLLLGAFIAYFLSRSSKDKGLADARVARGTLIASGFIAGTALFKIVEAIFRIIPGGAPGVSLLDNITASFGAAAATNSYFMVDHDLSGVIGMVLVFALCVWTFMNSMKATKED
jgi:hypothetical protein